VPVDTSAPTVSSLRAALRFAHVFAYIVWGLLIIVFRFPRLNDEGRKLRVQIWSRGLLLRLGIRMEVTGDTSLTGPLLLVSNHISWLDITSLHAARYCRFVSKADVGRWPLIGAMARGAGTLFIERESRRDALRVVHTMTESLRTGDVLAVFPEGTTSDGIDLLPFHANLLQAAIAAHVPVQPVALQFIDAASGQVTLAPCYIGDDTLLASVWRTLRCTGITARVVFGETQMAHGRDRRAWAHDLRDAVQALRKTA
jgi:1-acyl-sn-glycerol-3-phosphate acyltransferase